MSETHVQEIEWRQVPGGAVVMWGQTPLAVDYIDANRLEKADAGEYGEAGPLVKWLIARHYFSLARSAAAEREVQDAREVLREVRSAVEMFD